MNTKKVKETEKRFKDRFSKYLRGKEEYLDYIRDRWTNEEVVIIFEYGLRLGKRRRRNHEK